MDYLQAIRNNYYAIHDHFLPQMLSTEEYQLRQRVIAEINPIIWICWHILRSEDMYLNTVMFGDRQVFDEDMWMEKLNITTPVTGTGMSREEADHLSKRVSKAALLDYNQAVKLRSLEQVSRSVELGDDVFDSEQNIDKRLKTANAFPEGVRQERAKAYAQYPLSGGITGITMHGFMHIGQYLAITKPL